MLRSVLDPRINLGVWRRPQQQAIAREVSCLGATDLPDTRYSTSADSFDKDIASVLREHGLDPESFSHWRDDLGRLAEHYFQLRGGRQVTLRLVTTGDYGCRRFHVDRTHLRLLCTYRGPGTEWLPDAQVDRAAQSTGAPNEEIIRFGEPSRFSTFWVGLLKGSAYPGNDGHGLVHRSPSVECTDPTRVLFCLDS